MEELWKRPAWITAIVGLLSAFLTVPEIVGDYLENEQVIKERQLEEKFKIVNSALAQNGTERIFLLQYLSSSLEDEKTKKWADSEIKKLENIQAAKTEKGIKSETLKRYQENLRSLKSPNKEELELKIAKLREEIDTLTRKISNASVKAGLKEEKSAKISDNYVYIEFVFDWSSNDDTMSAIGGGDRFATDLEPYANCYRQHEKCTAIISSDFVPNYLISFTDHKLTSVTATLYKRNYPNGASPSQYYNYECAEDERVNSGRICSKVKKIESK